MIKYGKKLYDGPPALTCKVILLYVMTSAKYAFSSGYGDFFHFKALSCSVLEHTERPKVCRQKIEIIMDCFFASSGRARHPMHALNQSVGQMSGPDICPTLCVKAYVWRGAKDVGPSRSCKWLTLFHHAIVDDVTVSRKPFILRPCTRVRTCTREYRSMYAIVSYLSVVTTSPSRR